MYPLLQTTAAEGMGTLAQQVCGVKGVVCGVQNWGVACVCRVRGHVNAPCLFSDRE